MPERKALAGGLEGNQTYTQSPAPEGWLDITDQDIKMIRMTKLKIKQMVAKELAKVVAEAGAADRK